MIQFINIRHQYGAAILFEDFSWHIKPNQKIGLIGPNGSGKTTLFQMSVGKIKADSGDIVKSKNTQISLFQQIPDFDGEKLIIDTALSSNVLYKEYLTKKNIIDLDFEKFPHDSPEFEDVLHRQSELEDFANTHQLHNLEIEAKKILSGLGFSEQSFKKKVREFSPGYQHRLALTISLLNPHTLLLLDEPTNHLDDASKEWLTEFLISVKTTFVLVTHDPEFLNTTTNTIAEISAKGVIEFKGSLEEFLEEKNEIHEKMKVQFKKEEAYLNKRMEWINRFRAQATKARQVQSAVKKLEKRDRVENPEEIFWNKKPDYKFNFQPASKISFRLEDGFFQYDINGKVIFKNVNLEVSVGERIAIVGPNGAGKSTLMRCIVGKQNVTNGNLYFGPKTTLGYFSQIHSDDLDSSLSVLEVILKKYPDLTDVAARTVLGHFSFSGDSVYKKVASMSGGEQSRLRMALLVLQPVNCLLFDEPTNHLDMVTRDGLKRALGDFEGAIVIISHDPDFLKGLCNRTYELSGGELKNLNCSFDDYLIFHKEGVYIDKKDEPKASDNIDKAAERKAQNTDKNRIKKIQKEIIDIETKINELELNKKNLESKISSSDFYQNKNYQKDLDEYGIIKDSIQAFLNKWEELSLELED